MGQTYRIEIATAADALDSEGRAVLHDLHDYGLTLVSVVRTVRVYILHGDLAPEDAERIAREFLADAVVDRYAVDDHVLPEAVKEAHAVEIRRRQGVMDPAEQSVRKGAAGLGHELDWVRTTRKYLVHGPIPETALQEAAYKLLANEVIEEVAVGHDIEIAPPAAEPYRFRRVELPVVELIDDELVHLSTQRQLYLSLPEMKAIQEYYRQLGRPPTDIELETLAQTWSEHCVHKTFKGRIHYVDMTRDEERVIDNILKSTVARVTRELRKDWCLSVFVDNAGVIAFDDEYGVAFKVETHNHPSAIEPYGGAGTGIGGCIRDPLGTGLGARPVMNTDVFCFGLPDMPREEVPKGALHPLRVMKGVVAGVRDYGNRMGIPTANGSIHFDRRYTGNPLVFCGTVAIIPRELAEKRKPASGQLGIVVGGRTGRDGIHGATFSSVELDENSEMVSSGAVQIGNAIEEKKVHDFLLRARDAGLYTCITDCGAGGLSSALGEMGEETGVEVDLERVPLKYEGLSYTEIWISEAQERMVIAADEAKLEALRELAAEENVEITPIARFRDDGKLLLRYAGHVVGELAMDFVHNGLPQIAREAVWNPVHRTEPRLPAQDDYGQGLHRLLGMLNVCSKEWIIRQYDHEVQGNSVIKPLVGPAHDGPGDATVIAPVSGSARGVAVSNGLAVKYSDIDPYCMAAAGIDEALRNLLAVGADLERCAVLDNFCWGNCDKPDRLAGLVRAAEACYDIAHAYGVPFVSGKDSLNNEYGVGNETIAIPGTLLISAIAVMADVARALTMDLKSPGDKLYLVGATYHELGGSHWYALHDEIGANAPKVRTKLGKRVFAGVAEATRAGLVRAAHDLAEGGLAVAAAEMAFAGGYGATVELAPQFHETARGIDKADTAALLFSESQSRLLLEVPDENEARLQEILDDSGAPYACIGEVTDTAMLVIRDVAGNTVVNAGLETLKRAWREPLAL